MAQLTSIRVEYGRKKMPCFGNYNQANIDCKFCSRLERISHGTNTSWDDTFSDCVKYSSTRNNILDNMILQKEENVYKERRDRETKEILG